MGTIIKGSIDEMRDNLRKQKEDIKKARERTRTEHMEEAQSFYQTQQWKKLRALKLLNNPVCENHLKYGILKPAKEVHHKKIISSGLTYNDMCRLAYDYDNLQSTCRLCHRMMHQKAERLHLSYVDDITPPECEEY